MFTCKQSLLDLATVTMGASGKKVNECKIISGKRPFRRAFELSLGATVMFV